MIVLNPSKSVFQLAKTIIRDSPDSDPKEALRLALAFYNNRCKPGSSSKTELPPTAGNRE